MVKAMSTSLITINKVAEVYYVYYEKGHFFDDCSVNLASVNYVGNYNRQN